jgi:hypothetical protein
MTTAYNENEEKNYPQKMVYCMTDEEGTEWVLGLRDLASKSSDETLRVFKEVLEDIGESCSPTVSDAGKKILCSIGNTMSDMAATEVKFTRLLELWINEVIPMLNDPARPLAEGDAQLFVKLRPYFCGLHGLVHSAECADKAGREAEKGYFEGAAAPIFNPQFQQSGESAAGEFHDQANA